MHPVLFYLGPYPVFSYGVFILLGLIVLFAVALNSARRAGLGWEVITPLALGVGVGGVFGARLSHLIVEPDKLETLLDFYSLFRPGTPGNIVGLMVGGFFGGLMVRYSLNLPSQGNFYAPAMAAASVVWRVGCTLAGCCYGKGTTLVWGLYLDGLNRHPIMIYDALFNLGLFILLRRWSARVKRDNVLVYLYFAAYAFFRFWLEFLRGDDPQALLSPMGMVYPTLLFGLNGIQWLCLGILVGLGMWWRRARQTSVPSAQTGIA